MRWPHAILYVWQGPMVALRALREVNADHALVVDAKGNFKGSVTIDEVRQAAHQGISRLAQMALDTELQIGPDQTIEDVIPLAASSDHAVAVVDEEGWLVGEVPPYALFMGMMGEETGEELCKANGDGDGSSGW